MANIYPIIEFTVDLTVVDPFAASQPYAQSDNFKYTRSTFIPVYIDGDNINKKHGDKFTLFGQKALYLKKLIADGAVTNMFVSAEQTGDLTYIFTGNGTETFSGTAPFSINADYAASFTAASSKYLSCPNNATLRMGAGVHCTFALWVYILSDTGSSQEIMASYDGTGNQRAYDIQHGNGAGNVIFKVSRDGTAGTVTQCQVTGISFNTWYFICATYDGVNLGISKNNGAFTNTGYSLDIFASTATLGVGGSSTGSLFLNGYIDKAGMWKRVLTGPEITTLYNSGNGLQYTALSSGIKTSMVAYWDLNETSGTRMDSFGTNNLTDHNNVGYVPGVGT